MAAKDKSFSFEFGGTYTSIEPMKSIAYTMDDGRTCSIFFLDENCGTVKVTVNFDPESENPIDMQQQGRQAILDNFKKHVENI